MEKKRQTIETYNKSAEAMAKKFNDLGARREDVERLFSFLSEKNPFVLEIGCGNGRDAHEILKRTHNYLGIDIAKGFIDMARECAPKGTFEVADVENYHFPQGVNAIVAFASLLHSDQEQVARILAKAREALVPGGIFYISLKKGEYLEEGLTRNDEFGTRTYFFYTPALLQELAGQGYETVYASEQTLRGQEWFTLALKKI